MLALIPLIPLLPFAGFLFCGLFGRRVPKGLVTLVACGTVLAALVISIGAVAELSGGSLAAWEGTPGVEVDAAARHYQTTVWDWLPAGKMRLYPGADAVRLHVPFSLALDPLSAVMLLVVTGVGFLIHLYSVGYMAHDEGYARYFSYLNLFTAMMLTLVLGANFLVMFIGWEGVGLCSYLLIGFWYEDPEKAYAGRKAFIVNRVGDLAFVLGMVAMIATLGTLDIRTVMEAVGAGSLGPVGALAPTVIALALFIGACGKSAQLPLYVWLPDAMAGPTPVSALIHAATMVTAGVYMVSRCSALFLHAPVALGVVAVVGAATALFAATIGLAQNDIKKVLAYSTVSQLGFMFLGAGVGAFTASIFHLMTHAFFKALLFLGSGSVIHAMGGEQDMRKMGGLRSRLPVTYWTFLAGAIAIAGIPPLAGFFSKDEILAGVWGAGRPLLWVVGAVASLFTAFYMFRLILMTFHGEFRGTQDQEHHLHESPPSMTVPLVTLAILSIVGGWIGVPAVLGEPVGLPNAFEHWLAPVFETRAGGETDMAVLAGETRLPEMLELSQEAGPSGEHGGGHGNAPVLPLMAVATLIGLGGIGGAWLFYRPGSEVAAGAARAAGPVYTLVAGKFWVDELYDATVLRLYWGLCAVFDFIDRTLVDGLVNAVAAVSEGVGQVIRLFQTGFVRAYALLFLFGAAAVLWYLLR